MRIAFLTPEYATTGASDGGLANYLRKVGRMLSARGHEVAVFALSGESRQWKDGSVAIHEVRRTSAPLVLSHTPALRSSSPALMMALAAWRIRKAVLREHRLGPFDILQASSYWAPGLWLLHNGRIPLICRASSHTPMWRAAYGRKTDWGDRLCDRIEARQVLQADAVFAPSQLVASAYQKYLSIRPSVIPTPVESEPCEGDRSFFESHLRAAPYLVFFGTLSRIKGVDLLAECLPPVLRNHPKIEFVFVGRDDGLPNGQKAFDYVRARCAEFAARVRYFPAISKEQLYPVIEGAIGVVMPSRVDNLPNAALETQALGVPLIGTDQSSLEELITDGETGFLARNGDPASIGAAIERLLNLTEDARQKMKEALNLLNQRRKNEDRVGVLEKFYSDVIQQYRASRK